MNEKKINTSVKKCCICDNERCGQFIVINDKKYHLCCIEQLQQENNQLKEMQCTFLGTGCKRQLDLYKSVVDEVNEKIKEMNNRFKNGLFIDNYLGGRRTRELFEEIFQILSKVNKESE